MTRPRGAMADLTVELLDIRRSVAKLRSRKPTTNLTSLRALPMTTEESLVDSACAWRSGEEVPWEEGRGKLASNQLLLYRYATTTKDSTDATRTLEVLFVIPVTKSALAPPPLPGPCPLRPVFTLFYSDELISLSIM